MPHTLWAIKSSVPETGILCVLPAAMKVWQAKLLAYKQGKTSGLSQFLPEY